MSLSITDLTNEHLHCLKGLNSVQVSKKLPTNWNNGSAFVTKQITCKCGKQELILKSSSIKKTRGFFKKKEIIERYAPIAIGCISCGFEKVIFDPREHGYNGVLGMHSSIVGESEVTPIHKEPVEVYVNYSYQGIENYEDLIEEGIINPADYFDTFQVYFLEKQRPELQLLVAYECA